MPFDLLTDQNDVSETQFLKSSIVNHTKYGSTNHNTEPPQNFRYITHYVDSSDTLQGLALKYGCKVRIIDSVAHSFETNRLLHLDWDHQEVQQDLLRR